MINLFFQLMLLVFIAQIAIGGYLLFKGIPGTFNDIIYWIVGEK